MYVLQLILVHNIGLYKQTLYGLENIINKYFSYHLCYT